MTESPLLPGTVEMAREVNFEAREARILRAAEQVLARYTISEQETDTGLRRFSLTGGTSEHGVAIQSIPTGRGLLSARVRMPEGLRRSRNR